MMLWQLLRLGGFLIHKSSDLQSLRCLFTKMIKVMVSFNKKTVANQSNDKMR